MKFDFQKQIALIYKNCEELIKKIGLGDISPVYLLHGEESFYIDEATHYFEKNLIPESSRDFNQEILYGSDIDSALLVDYARQYPMMSAFRLIVVREAQDLKLDEKFDAYLTNPTPTTILVLAHKNRKADGRKNWAKTIKDKFVILESNNIKEWELEKWISEYIRKKGYKIESRATELIGEYLGVDLSKLRNELDKLIVNQNPGTVIDMNIVEKNIGISKDYNVFELQDALTSRNFVKSHRIVASFQANMNRQPLEVVLGSLFSFYQRLFIVKQNITQKDGYIGKVAGINPYFISKSKEQAKLISEKAFHTIFKILRDYDGRSKGLNNRSTSREELLKEMVGKLLLVA